MFHKCFSRHWCSLQRHFFQDAVTTQVTKSFSLQKISPQLFEYIRDLAELLTRPSSHILSQRQELSLLSFKNTSCCTEEPSVTARQPADPLRTNERSSADLFRNSSMLERLYVTSSLTWDSKSLQSPNSDKLHLCHWGTAQRVSSTIPLSEKPIDLQV